MTREKAIGLMRREHLGPPSWAMQWIDVFVRLGMLKLDDIPQEPITLCGEDPDWNWWLAQPPAFKAAAVKQIRSRQVPDNGERAIQKLLDACKGVPYLATSINETIDKAGLKIVEK